jgi:inosine-uridine nucleoside N-ribohydrolase
MLTAEYAHGKDGLGNIFMPKSNRKIEEQTAEDFIIEAANKYKDNLTFICLGPLTNLASALKKDKDLDKKIKNVIIMGSTYNPLVKEPYKEFNVKIDPEAAKLVFSKSFENIKIITHDIGVKSFIEKDYINSLKNSSNKVSRFVYAISQKYMEFCLNKYNINGLATPDPTTMAYVINNGLISFKPCTIEIKDDLSYVNLTENSNIMVSVDLDIQGFRNLFKNTFK